jgi:hypothetical protein
MVMRILLVLSLCAASALAQRNTGARNTNPGNINNPNRDPFGNNRGGGPRDTKVISRYDSLASKLGLDKDQKKVIRTLFDQISKEAEPIRQEMARNNHALYAAVKAGKGDAELNQMVEKQSALYARMAALETRAFAGLFKQLDDGQQKRAEEIMPRLAGMFQNKKWSSVE